MVTPANDTKNNIENTKWWYQELFDLLKNKYFYLALALVIFGIALNYASQTYLYNHTSGGEELPRLSDLILDNIPYFDISFIYDWFALFANLVFLAFIIVKKQYKKIPYFLFLIGIFQVLRGLFIILTPLGNPPNFNGTNSKLHGFSRYELGVYPSGHTANSFMYFLLAKGIYRWIIFFLCLIIIAILFLARGHYSIDILSGLIFSYAIYCFGEKYIKKRFAGE